MKDFIFFLNTLLVVLNITLHFFDRSLGLHAQIVLAFFQLTIALAYTVAAFRGDSAKLKKLLMFYWVLVLGYFILCRLANDVIDPGFLIIGLPMSIACYFVYVTYSVSKTN